MKKSNYFRELGETYCADMDSLSFDFEGKKVLQQRLKAMRRDVSGFLPLIGEAPEMVAQLFHDAFNFKKRQDAESLLTKSPHTLPSWKYLSSRVVVADWASPLVAAVLKEEGGETFLATAAALDFLYRLPVITPVADEDGEINPGDDDSERSDSDERLDDDGRDLGQAGQSWLEEQGFDRREEN